jgi:hypothetical protein
LAAQDKERYNREMTEWAAKCKEMTYASIKAKKVRTRALSAYNFFMAKNRQEICDQVRWKFCSFTIKFDLVSHI